MAIIWTIIIGFVVGVIAKLIMGGPNEPKGCIVTTVLGIAGAFLATYAGRYMGWYAPGETAGFIGAILGAVVLLALFALISGRR
ncbi:MAG: GlsB/YeaQ/YmgE family stress response membrane protein [Sphingomonadales bacterium]